MTPAAADVRPRVYIGSTTPLPSSAAAMRTDTVVALAPLTIAWGRSQTFAEPEAATATITLALRAERALPPTIKIGTWVWITIPRPGTFAYVFSGTVRDIAITAPTTRTPHHATVQITAADDIASLKAARLYQLRGGVWNGQPITNVWPAESAEARVTRIIRAVQPAAVVRRPEGMTPDAIKLLGAKVHAVGNADQTSTYSVGVWDLLTETLNACACTIHHTPLRDGANDQRATYTLVPWGEAAPLAFFQPVDSSLVPRTDLRVTSTLGARTDLIEVTHYPFDPAVGGDIAWADKPVPRSKTLHPSPQSTLRLTTGLAVSNTAADIAKGLPIDLLITRIAAILTDTRWDLTSITPRIDPTKDGSTASYQLAPHTRCQTQVTLIRVPQWLGMGSRVPTAPLGGTLTWTGKTWTHDLRLTRQTFQP